MKQRKKIGKKLFGLLLTMVIVIGLVQWMGMTALAWDGDPYTSLLNNTTVVNFDGKEWYLIENSSTALNAGTVTLLSKECVGASQFYSTSGRNAYSGSIVESFVNSWYAGNISTDAKAAVDGNGMFLLTKEQANGLSSDVLKCSQASEASSNLWWLCSPGSMSIDHAACVYGGVGFVYDHGEYVYYKLGVRPALKLNLESVIFESASNTFTVASENSSPSKKNDSKEEEKQHTHHYVWETIEATENSDGELRYKCDICGDNQTRVPITAYYVFNKNTSEKIRKAGQGATVKIETSRWISFHKMVMEALADRPDVNLEVSFLDGEYKGNRVSFTIPAGTDTLSLLDENGFSGFLYLAGKFGTAN